MKTMAVQPATKTKPEHAGMTLAFFIHPKKGMKFGYS